MAIRTANNGQQAQAAPTKQNAASFILTGKLDSVYVGKKFAYAKIHVSTGGRYYDLYNVAFPLDTDFPDDGATVLVCGTMHTFKGNVQFTGTDITGLDKSLHTFKGNAQFTGTDITGLDKSF